MPATSNLILVVLVAVMLGEQLLSRHKEEKRIEHEEHEIKEILKRILEILLEDERLLKEILKKLNPPPDLPTGMTLSQLS